MLAEFTAIYEPRPNGVFTAYVAEIRAVNTQGNTLEEARSNLTERLRGLLEFERRQALAIASTNAHIESIRVEINTPQESARARTTVAAVPKKKRRTRAETDVLQTLLEQGLIDKIPPIHALDTDRLEPIPIKGKPISEEIIEDRR